MSAVLSSSGDSDFAQATDDAFGDGGSHEASPTDYASSLPDLTYCQAPTKHYVRLMLKRKRAIKKKLAQIKALEEQANVCKQDPVGPLAAAGDAADPRSLSGEQQAKVRVRHVPLAPLVLVVNLAQGERWARRHDKMPTPIATDDLLFHPCYVSQCVRLRSSTAKGRVADRVTED